MSAKDATMCANYATMCANYATMSAKGATMCAKDAPADNHAPRYVPNEDANLEAEMERSHLLADAEFRARAEALSIVRGRNGATFARDSNSTCSSSYSLSARTVRSRSL